MSAELFLDRCPMDQWFNVPVALYRDRTLSSGARDMLCQLMSNRNGWRLNTTRLCELLGKGRDWVRDRLRELEGANYLWRTQRRTSDGKLGSYVWVVSWHPMSEARRNELERQDFREEPQPDPPLEDEFTGDVFSGPGTGDVFPGAGKTGTIRKNTNNSKNTTSTAREGRTLEEVREQRGTNSRMFGEEVRDLFEYFGHSISIPVVEKLMIDLVTNKRWGDRFESPTVPWDYLESKLAELGASDYDTRAVVRFLLRDLDDWLDAEDKRAAKKAAGEDVDMPSHYRTAFEDEDRGPKFLCRCPTRGQATANLRVCGKCGGRL